MGISVINSYRYPVRQEIFVEGRNPQISQIKVHWKFSPRTMILELRGIIDEYYINYDYPSPRSTAKVFNIWSPL